MRHNRYRSYRVRRKILPYVLLVMVILILALFLLIFNFYPLQAVVTRFDTKDYSHFISYWPMSPLQKELGGKKRKRQKKEAHMVQKLSPLSTSIYNLYSAPNAQLSTTNLNTTVENNAFQWPILPGQKLFINRLKSQQGRRSSLVLLPAPHFTEVVEGILLFGGDTLKLKVPLSENKRVLNFSVFPLMPGSLRILLGKYAWERYFSQDDVQKRVKISVPINDTTTTNMKILNLSASLYLLDTNVTTLSSSEENIIYVKIPMINKDILNNKNLFNKLAPTLSTLSPYLDTSCKNINSTQAQFHFSDYNVLINKGYELMSIGYGSAFQYADALSYSSGVANLYGRWLQPNDWELEQENMLIEDENKRASGLNAIFKGHEKKMPPVLHERNFKNISNFLGITAEQGYQMLESNSTWNIGKYLLIDNRNLYTAKTIYALQNWVEENKNSKFFLYLLLDNKQKKDRPAFKDFRKALVSSRFSILRHPTKIDEFVSLVYLDRAITQILETLKLYKLDSRTKVIISCKTISY